MSFPTNLLPWQKLPQSHTCKTATHGEIKFVCKPAIIYNVLNNHVAKMVVHSCRPTVSSRGGQKSHPRMTNNWTRSTFQYYKLTDFDQCK